MIFHASEYVSITFANDYFIKKQNTRNIAVKQNLFANLQSSEILLTFFKYFSDYFYSYLL